MEFIWDKNIYSWWWMDSYSESVYVTVWHSIAWHIIVVVYLHAWLRHWLAPNTMFWTWSANIYSNSTMVISPNAQSSKPDVYCSIKSSAKNPARLYLCSIVVGSHESLWSDCYVIIVYNNLRFKHNSNNTQKQGTTRKHKRKNQNMSDVAYIFVTLTVPGNHLESTSRYNQIRFET